MRGCVARWCDKVVGAMEGAWLWVVLSWDGSWGRGVWELRLRVGVKGEHSVNKKGLTALKKKDYLK